MYVISCRSLIDAIIRAARRGVVVRIFTDLCQAQAFPGAYREFFATSLIQMNHRGTLSSDMHEKYAIVDGGIVISGSANWSAAAFNRRNFEACTISRGHAMANRFTKHFRTIWSEGQYTTSSLLDGIIRWTGGFGSQ